MEAPLHRDDRLGVRFPDMSAPYDAGLRALAREVALGQRIVLREGVYAAVSGPTLETRAEYRMLRTLGADVVGMSTVPEVIVAVHGGMRVLGFSIMTDRCLPDSLEAVELSTIIANAGIPPGVFNLVMGRGSVVGETLIRHSDVAAISFTGSVATGQAIAQACVAGMKKFQLEMGGKNPLVVLDDADLGVAVECAANGALFSTGQRCTASSRLIVTEGIHDRFVQALTERMAALVVDDALRPGTHIGPAVDQSQLEQDLRYVEIGKTEGARLVRGGERLSRDAPGFYVAPTLFTEVANDMRIAREEIFGPVAAVIRVKDYDAALATANDTAFGLTAGICTTSLKHAAHFKRNADAGMVMVNLPTAGVDYHVPFGGRKGSSYGPREQGRYAAEFYTVVKTAYTLP